MDGTKTCNTCGEAKAHEWFPKHRNQCRQCHNGERHTKYPDSPIQQRNRSNAFRKNYPEKVKALKAIYRITANEKYKTWQKKYADKNIAALGDSYVKLCIAKICNVSAVSIPPDLVETKRKLLLIFRKIKEMKNA